MKKFIKIFAVILLFVTVFSICAYARVYDLDEKYTRGSFCQFIYDFLRWEYDISEIGIRPSDYGNNAINWFFSN